MARYEVLDEVRVKKQELYDIVFQKVRDKQNDEEGYRFVWTDRRGRIMANFAAFLYKEDFLELIRKAQNKGWFSKSL